MWWHKSLGLTMALLIPLRIFIRRGAGLRLPKELPGPAW